MGGTISKEALNPNRLLKPSNVKRLLTNPTGFAKDEFKSGGPLGGLPSLFPKTAGQQALSPAPQESSRTRRIDDLKGKLNLK